MYRPKTYIENRAVKTLSTKDDRVQVGLPLKILTDSVTIDYTKLLLLRTINILTFQKTLVKQLTLYVKKLTFCFITA